MTQSPCRGVARSPRQFSSMSAPACACLALLVLGFTAGCKGAGSATSASTKKAFGAGSSLQAGATATGGYNGVLTYHYDLARSGVNARETILATSNVNSAQFGKLFSLPLDGASFAQPLYVENVEIPGKGLHNVVYVATMNDSVYAFDADGKTGAPLWRKNYLDPDNGITSYNSGISIPGTSEQIGITGTPVIDLTDGVVWVVAFVEPASISSSP